MDIKKQLTTCPKEKPKDESKLGFGHIFTDHMLVMPYDEGQGWHDPQPVCNVPALRSDCFRGSEGLSPC